MRHGRCSYFPCCLFELEVNWVCLVLSSGGVISIRKKMERNINMLLRECASTVTADLHTVFISAVKSQSCVFL